MATNGFLAFDPAINGVSNAVTKLAGAGGGNISGAGNFYSVPSNVGQDRTECSDVVVITGTLTGTMTREVANVDYGGAEQSDAIGQTKWVGFTETIPAIAGAASFGLSNTIRYTRYRLKFVYASGSGTLEVRRTIKGRS